MPAPEPPGTPSSSSFQPPLAPSPISLPRRPARPPLLTRVRALLVVVLRTLWSVLVTVRRRGFTAKIWTPILFGLIGSEAALLVLLELGAHGFYRVHYALTVVYPALLAGFWLSLEVVGVILTVGFTLGLMIGWARTSRSAILRGFGGIYVDFFRSMPPIALIVFFNLIGAIELGTTNLNPYAIHTITLWFGAVALALHTAAYQAEIFRAGILSVPTGQTEAADAVGLSRFRSMFSIVLPQAFRVSLPALGNEFSSSIKDTSLLNVIGWLEISGQAYVLSSNAVTEYSYLYGSLVVWLEAAMFYFVLTYIATRTVRAIEDLFRVPGLEAAHL